MHTPREVLERRYVDRTISVRQARALSRKEARNGNRQSADYAAARAQQHNSAAAEIRKVARDMGIELDIDALLQRATRWHNELEQTLRVFNRLSAPL